jgi:hypothetical protein
MLSPEKQYIWEILDQAHFAQTEEQIKVRARLEIFVVSAYLVNDSPPKHDDWVRHRCSVTEQQAAADF